MELEEMQLLAYKSSHLTYNKCFMRVSNTCKLLTGIESLMFSLSISNIYTWYSLIYLRTVLPIFKLQINAITLLIIYITYISPDTSIQGCK